MGKEPRGQGLSEQTMATAMLRKGRCATDDGDRNRTRKRLTNWENGDDHVVQQMRVEVQTS